MSSGLFSVGVSQAPHHLDWQGVDLGSGSNRGLECELVSVGCSGWCWQPEDKIGWKLVSFNQILSLGMGDQIPELPPVSFHVVFGAHLAILGQKCVMSPPITLPTGT